MSDFDYVVKITDNTSGTVTLTTAPFQIRKPEFRSAKRDEPSVENVIDVRLRDGTSAANLDELRTLNNLLRKAHDRNKKKDRRIDPVYVVWKESASADEYRSEIMTAHADWIGGEALTLPYWEGDTQFAEMPLERVNWWEGPEAAVPLTNPNGTANTSGLDVYNSNDGSGGIRYNYVDIAGTSVAGDLPGATRLEILNNYATDRLAWVWIGQNWQNPSTFNHWLEAESATHSGTVHADASNSGGTAITDGIPDSTETTMFTWTISSAQLTAAAGGYFKALLRYGLGSANPNVRHRFRIRYNAATLWQTDLLTLDSNHAIKIRDLATFQLPPWLPGLSSLEAVDLVLTAYQTTGIQVVLYFDSLQLTPVDGWRALEYIGYGTPQNSRIVDDGINKRLYQDDGAGANKIGIYIGYGQPIQLRPATAQRLYFQMHAVSLDTAEVDRKIRVKLFYRPRRLSL